MKSTPFIAIIILSVLLAVESYFKAKYREQAYRAQAITERVQSNNVAAIAGWKNCNEILERLMLENRNLAEQLRARNSWQLRTNWTLGPGLFMTNSIILGATNISTLPHGRSLDERPYER